ncbi:MAG: ATP-dependent RecD-like DNA helicase [Waddliaceae bacterium]
MDQVFGYIERITFQNPENGYTVAQLLQPKKSNLTCIVGIMPSLQPGETVRCFGLWKRHLVHGQQFEVSKYHVEAPADVIGIKKYLGSGLIKGIGPVYAGRIVEEFGVDTLDVIDLAPERLLEIRGLGKKRLEKIKTCWNEQKSIREVMIFLQANGVSPTYAQKIFKTYGNQSVKKVKDNPFTLAKDIIGIGFKTADRIAGQLGIAKNSPQRIESGIGYILSELSSDGHVCFPVEPFLEEAKLILEVSRDLIQERMGILKNEGSIVLEELVHEGSLQEFIWKKPLYSAEMGIALEIKRLLQENTRLRAVNREKALEWVQGQLNIKLGDNQKIAVANALSKKIQIITGGPGTGKSTITNAILTITEKITDKIFLAAPTGRAAKRMTEITGKKAYTIHSLLEFNFKIGGFKRNRESPLDCDLIIIDEASMIDTLLMNSLLKAIPSHARAVFVGDINQLPSIGPGNVLKDIITSRCIPVTMLNEIFRQAAGSCIVTNAHLINNGKYPDISNLPNSDFFFVEANDPEKALKQILTLVTQRIPKKYRYHPIDEIQVLAPMKKGILGTENLNAILQETLNHKDNPLIRYGKKLAVDDKVMQIRNNYRKNVYNGDVGRITKIDNIEQQVIIKYDNREVDYDFSDLDEVVLAYAVSIHKYQGSECPCIVIPIHTSHFKLLHRNLLYTGVTRGKELVILVGMKKALGIAVKNDEVKKRYTGLQQALLEIHNPAPRYL